MNEQRKKEERYDEIKRKVSKKERKVSVSYNTQFLQFIPPHTAFTSFGVPCTLKVDRVTFLCRLSV